MSNAFDRLFTALCDAQEDSSHDMWTVIGDRYTGKEGEVRAKEHVALWDEVWSAFQEARAAR